MKLIPWRPREIKPGTEPPELPDTESCAFMLGGPFDGEIMRIDGEPLPIVEMLAPVEDSYDIDPVPMHYRAMRRVTYRREQFSFSNRDGTNEHRWNLYVISGMTTEAAFLATLTRLCALQREIRGE